MCSLIICLVGHYDPAPPRQYKRPPQKGCDPNDGHAPDTDMALHSQGIQDAVTRNSSHLQSYQWHINSCFFDHSLEAWFRAFSCWPQDVKQSFSKLLPPDDSLLSAIFRHFNRRLKAIHNPTDKTTFSRELELIQALVRDCIFQCWKLYAHPNAHGCAMTWLAHAIQVSRSLNEITGANHYC